MEKIKFVVEGEPKGKGRHRMANGQAYTPDGTLLYENLIKWMYRQQCRGYKFPDDAQLDVRIIAYYGIPKSKPKKTQKLMENHTLRPLKKPDADNVVKVFLDALNKLAWKDDTQVVDIQVRRFYSYEPRVVVSIQEAKL